MNYILPQAPPISNFCYLGPYDERSFQCILNKDDLPIVETHLCSRYKRTYENISSLEPEAKRRIVQEGEEQSIVPVFYPKQFLPFFTRIKNTD